MDRVEPDGPLRRRGRGALLRLVRPWSLPTRWTVVLSLALLGLGAFFASAARSAQLRPYTSGESSLTGWELALAFAVAGVCIFHIEINSESQSFSLSEVPLVLGLLFLHPGELIIARLVGEIAVLIAYYRQSAPKLVFNLSVLFAETTLALALFGWVNTGRDALDPITWLAAWGAVGVASLLGAGAVAIVIRVHGAPAKPRELLAISAVTATGNVCLAAVAAVLLCQARAALVPLVIIAAVVMAAYRGYTRLTKRYDGLQMLFQFTRITSGPQRPEETLRRVLDEAGRLLRGRRALIAMFHPGQDVPWLCAELPESDPDGGREPTSLLLAGTLPDEIRQLVLSQGKTLLLPRTTRQPGHQALLAQLRVKDCIAAPLVSGGEISGVLLVADRLGEVSTFDQGDARLFSALASQGGVALENGRLIERLQEQVKAREHEATHDALTGLPNRTLFSLHLGRALDDEAARRVGVLLMDLDGFKEVNDALGHSTGDELLRVVAERLLAAIGGRGFVARLGGDEFAVLLPELDDAEQAVAIATTINEAVRRPVTTTALTVEIGASIGVAIWPEHGDNASTLLARADVAMYTAKRNGLGVNCYDATVDGNSERRLRLAVELRTAIERHDIEVHYQPIARTVDGRVVSAEALARWQHPELGRIGPDEFVPIAERSGLVHGLTLYVLDRALAQTRIWNAAGLDVSVAVNLPPQILRDLDWPAKVAHLLNRHSVKPQQLTFEITETGIMTDPEYMIRMLDDLARTGISFAIDDFGTGYSSLAYLQQLPVNKIKIDKSFVIPLSTDPSAASIVRSVIDLARSLGLVVVAEGVEDQRTLDQLTALDCHLVQGYFLSRPIPGAELTEWMTQRLRARADQPLVLALGAVAR